METPLQGVVGQWRPHFREWLDNEDPTFREWQDNEDPAFREWQDNEDPALGSGRTMKTPL